MSPYRINDYPAWAVFMIRTARTALYTCSVSTGVAAVIFTPDSLNRTGSWPVVGTMVVFGLICLTGVILQKFILEWISLFFLAGGLSLYVAAVWISAIGRPSVIAGASMFTMLVLFLIIRLVELTVFWVQNYKTARLNREMSND